MRRISLLLACVAAPLPAQENAPWRTSYFPYLIGDPNNGLMLVGHLQRGRQASYDARVPFDGIFTIEAGIGTRGSRFVVTRFRGPLLVPGWRFTADAGAAREGKFGYYGPGPEGETGVVDPSQPTDFYRVHRTRYFLRAEATRRIAGPLQAALAGGLAYYRFTRVDGGDEFRTDYFDDPLTGTDVTGRFSLVLDTRNNEFLPANGVLLEAGVYGGTGRFEERNIPPFAAAVSYLPSYSGRGYAGAYAHLRGYVSPRGGTVIAGRVALRTVGKNAPLDVRYQMPDWERDLSVYGGFESHRSFVRGRFLGRELVFTSLEIRHNLLDVGDYGGITLIAFADAGRAFGDAGTLTLHGWKVGAGGGIALRVLRSALLTFNFAGGPDGFTFSMGNGWAF